MEHEWAAVEEEEEEETHFASNGDDDDNDDDDDDNDISCRRATRIIVVVSAQAVELDGNRSSPPSEPVRTLDVVRILCPSWSSPLPPSSPMTPRLLLPAVKHPHHHHHHHRTTVITAARSLVSSSFRG